MFFSGNHSYSLQTKEENFQLPNIQNIIWDTKFFPKYVNTYAILMHQNLIQNVVTLIVVFTGVV